MFDAVQQDTRHGLPTFQERGLDPSFQHEGKLGIILGGTSFRVIVPNKDLRIAKYMQCEWSQYKDALDPFVFVQRLAEFTVDVLAGPKDLPIRPLSRVGVSVAGYVRPDQIINTPNTKVPFLNFDFAQTFGEALGRAISTHNRSSLIDLPVMTVRNDGDAAMRGQFFHPDGLLRGVRIGTADIRGTGWGGAGGERGIWIPEMSELGHIHLCKRGSGLGEGVYEIITLDELERTGCFNGRFIKPPPDYQWGETKQAGPWLAVQAVKYFQALGMFREVLEVTKLTTEEVAALDMDPLKLEAWGTEAHGPAVKAILSLIFAPKIEDLLIRKARELNENRSQQEAHEPKGEYPSAQRIDRLMKAALDFREAVIVEHASAAIAYAKRFPKNERTILCSTIPKLLSQDPRYLATIRKALERPAPEKSPEVFIATMEKPEEGELYGILAEEPPANADPLADLTMPPPTDLH